jgi:Glycine-rich domain-containing protein-like
MDCERVYGRILDCKNVESSVQAGSKKQSEEIWARFYPDEPFEFDYNKIGFETVDELNTQDSGGITYDLVAAVQRQSSFYYQVDNMASVNSKLCFVDLYSAFNRT